MDTIKNNISIKSIRKLTDKFIKNPNNIFAKRRYNKLDIKDSPSPLKAR